MAGGRPTGPRNGDSIADTVADTTAATITPDAAASGRHVTFDRPLGPFAFGRELGRGGMGRVLVATDQALDREVAIKQSLSTADVDLRRFEREARITAGLEHPSIAPIYEAGRDDNGHAYYAMRKVDGDELSKRVAATSTDQERLALVPYLLAAVDAAAYAHSRGVIHRDIKPANILVGAFGATTLIDWGLARQIEAPDDADPSAPTGSDAVTHAGAAYGTSGYMPPEQARGERVDARADVFALGATLLHVLLGRPPFAGSAVEWIARVVDDAEPFRQVVSEIGEDVPRELVTIIAKATRADPVDRYRDAGQLASDLRAFLDGRLVSAHRYTRSQRLLRFVRAHRAVVGIGVVATITAVIAAVLYVRNLQAETARVEQDARRANHEAAAEVERSNRLRIDQASSLAGTDPARAIAILKSLPIRDADVHKAAVIATYAGIPHGSAVHSARVHQIVPSRDGRSLLTVGDDGVVAIIDIDTARTRIVARTGARIRAAAWTPDGAIVVNVSTGGVRRVDPTTGPQQLLDPGAHEVTFCSTTGPDHVRYYDPRRKSFIELSLRDGTTKVLVSDVRRAACDRGHAVVVGNGRARVFDEAGTEVASIANAELDAATITAISRRLGRVAFAVPSAILDWELASGAMNRHPAGTTHRLVFSDELYSLERTIVTRLAEPRRRFTLPDLPHYLVPHERGLITVTDFGGIHLLEAGIARRYNSVPTKITAAAATANVLALGSNDGTVVWWVVDRVFPPQVACNSCHVLSCDGEHIYVQSFEAIVEIDKHTRHTRVITSAPLQVESHGRIGSLVAIQLQAASAVGLLDLSTGAIAPLYDASQITADPDRGAFSFVRGRSLVERFPNGHERVVFTTQDDILDYAAAGRYVAIRTSGDLVRVDREQKSSIRVGSSDGPVTVLSSGDVWYANADLLTQWRKSAVVIAHRFDARVLRLFSQGGTVELETVRNVFRIDGDAITLLGGKSQFSKSLGFVRFDPRPGHVSISLGKAMFAIPVPSGGAVRYEPKCVGADTLVVTDQMQLVLYTHAVPLETGALDRWLLQATNAEIDDKTQELRWKE